MRKMFEEDSFFHVKYCSAGKVQFLFFKKNFAGIDKISF